MYKSFRNMVASAIVGGDMSNMNPRIWERAVFSAKELTPGTFRNSLRSSIRVRLPPTGQFAKGALIKLIMAECKKLGAKYLFISEFTTTNSNKNSTKNGVLPPPTTSPFSAPTTPAVTVTPPNHAMPKFFGTITLSMLRARWPSTSRSKSQF